MNPIDRLRAAELATEQGRHAEALEGFLWFHHHALAERPSLSGVRLSFALASWLDLAHDYPPAMAAFQQLRDDNTARIRAGALDWDLFHEVVAFNEALGEEDLTHRLFCDIAAQNPEFAARCARVATPAMVKARDFARARSYIADPEAAVGRLATTLAEDATAARTAATPELQQARLEAHIHIYADTVGMLAKIVRGTGEPDRATGLLALALERVDDPEVRSAVRDKINGQALNGSPMA